MAEYPNDASRKSKAEGDRWSSNSESAGDRNSRTDDASGAVTNRSEDEEMSKQRDMDMDRDDRRSER
jgi:hypothetical protein